jgi:uncharacterized membrane protein YkoI
LSGRFVKGLLALTLLSASGLSSARDLDQDEALRLRQEGKIRPLEQLISQAYARYPKATLLEAELEEEDGVYVYEIELLVDKGVVRELEISATDGTILKDEVDD